MTTQSFEAVLVTGPTETRYRRAGAGAPVLLLFAGGPADPLGARLFARLAERFRVIAPARPAGVPLSKWLRDLIDGLGLARPCLVTDESLAGAALGFALVEHDRVGGVVAVHRDGADPGCPPAVEDRLAGGAQRLLVVAADPAGDGASAAERILAFLQSAEPQARGC